MKEGEANLLDCLASGFAGSSHTDDDADVARWVLLNAGNGVEAMRKTGPQNLSSRLGHCPNACDLPMAKQQDIMRVCQKPETIRRLEVCPMPGQPHGRDPVPAALVPNIWDLDDVPAEMRRR